MIRRRDVLSGIGTAGLVGIAGCLGGDDGGRDVVAPEARLLDLVASNYDGGTWADAGDNGNDATQDEADRTPSRSPDAADGQPAVAFDGEDDVLVSSLDFSPSARPEATVFVVFRANTGERGRRKLYGNDNSGYDRVVGLDDRARTNLTYFDGTQVAPYADIEADRWYVATQYFQPSSFTGWIDGERTRDVAPTEYGESKTSLAIGSDGDNSYFWDGHIAELRVYDDTLSADQRGRIQDTLADTYGVG